jgi:hypothetical protein
MYLLLYSINTYVMEQIIQLLQGQEWFSIVSAIVVLASTVAALTPTPAPGTSIASLYKVIDVLALNIGKAKQKGNDN